MNVLLWRSEFGGHSHVGSSVPPALIWHKILSAPDPSQLEILHNGEKIGYGRWTAVVGQSGIPKKPDSTDGAPEGMMDEQPANYQIDFQGNATLGESPRLNFYFNMMFDTNHVWQEFKARLNLRPTLVELRSRAAEQAIHFHMDGDDGRLDRVLKFTDLENPAALERELGLPPLLPMDVPGGWNQAPTNSSGGRLTPGLVWEARNDWVVIAHTSVRAYRLQARLLDRYDVVVMVSLVGEILRLELPGDWVLVNDQLTTL
jgi:hypothetical protein